MLHFYFCPIAQTANVFGGLITVMKTAGKTYRDMLINGEAGLKMAFGENPKRVYGDKDKTPSTRMATMAIARQGFYEAKEYLKKNEEDKEFFISISRYVFPAVFITVIRPPNTLALPGVIITVVIPAFIAS